MTRPYCHMGSLMSTSRPSGSRYPENGPPQRHFPISTTYQQDRQQAHRIGRNASGYRSGYAGSGFFFRLTPRSPAPVPLRTCDHRPRRR